MFDFYQPRSVTLRGGLILLPQFGSPSGGTHRPFNAYALVFGDRCVLFDAPHLHCAPGVRKLVDGGVTPVGCLLSHADLTAGDGFDALRDDFGMTFMLHPADQKDPRAERMGIDWRDPAGALADLPVEVIHWPGHSPGSVMLYTPEHGGVLLTGDAAVGPGPMQPDGTPPLVRPKVASEEGDRGQLDRWRAFHRDPLGTLAPLHGDLYIDHPDVPGLIRGLIDAPPLEQAVRRMA